MSTTPRPALKATGVRRRYACCLETELAAAKAECERLKFATEGHLLKTIQQQAELAAEREKVRVLREALEKVRQVVTPPKGPRNTRDGHIEAIAYHALAATKEDSR